MNGEKLPAHGIPSVGYDLSRGRGLRVRAMALALTSQGSEEMPLITWGPALSVGVEEIDDQHQRLIVLVNELNDAMQAGQGKAKLGAVLSELVRYTVYHFATEERLMDKYHYELSVAHRAAHRKLEEDVGAFKIKFDAGDATISTELMNFLRDWLSRHILATDKKLAQALNKAGVK